MHKINKFLEKDKIFKDLFLDFKKKIKNIKKKSFLIAVSGGPDSLALVIFSFAYQYVYKKTNFKYAIVDHSIRKNSAIEAQNLKKKLSKLKINLKIIKNKRKIKSNIQSNAREIRYNLLSSYCKKNKIPYIVTAHHSDDQIETFLIRLSRGSGLQGLSSMSEISKLNNDIKIFRPFLSFQKNQLVRITKVIFKNFVKDPSNNNKKFLRTNIRRLVKTLNNMGIESQQILRSIRNISSSNNFINNYFNKIFKQIVVSKKSKYVIDLKRFNEQSDEIQIKTFNKIFNKINKKYYPSRAKKVISMYKALKNKDFAKTTLANCLIEKKGLKICVKREQF